MKLKENTFDLILLDVNLPDGNGFDLVKMIGKDGTAKVFVEVYGLEDNSFASAVGMQADMIEPTYQDIVTEQAKKRINLDIGCQYLRVTLFL